jgi:hypothetical protein
MASASRYCRSERRQNTPSGIVPARVATSSRTTSYGPATSAVMYDDRRGVGSNVQRATSTPSTFAASGARAGSGVGWLETTCQWAGAAIVNWKVALRSGCSKTAYIRRESGTWNWV